MQHKKHIPIDVVGLLPQLDSLLLDILQKLSPEQWQQPTVARLWNVKDVTAHLLDGNIRVLSMLQDGYFGESPVDISYTGLVSYLNGLNADWVKAMKRVSPSMLLVLHQLTGPMYCNYYASLDPFALSPFAVSWAGDAESPNWKHIAREYTEKFLHQQQIRDAIGNTDLLNSSYFTTFLSVFMLGLPYTYRDITAATGSVVRVTVDGEYGGTWQIRKQENGWELLEATDIIPVATITIPADTSWKLFSKSIRPADCVQYTSTSGDVLLAERALEMVSVMA